MHVSGLQEEAEEPTQTLKTLKGRGLGIEPETFLR